MDITIPNWDNYQPRKDLKKLSWFRLDADIFSGETYFHLKNDGIIVFIFLLTIAAKDNSSTFSVSHEFIADKTKIKKDDVLSIIEILEQNQLVHVSVQVCTETCPTLHNITNKQTLHNTNTISTEPQKAVALVDVKKTVTIKLSSDKEIIIKQELVASWADTYPKDFLELSLKEMKNWILTNSAKAPKSNWGRFMNSWFQRGWERHRKTMVSNPVGKISQDDLEKWIQG